MRSTCRCRCITIACLYRCWRRKYRCWRRNRGSSHRVASLLHHGEGLGGRHILPGLSGHVDVVSLLPRVLLYWNSDRLVDGHWNLLGVGNLSGPELLRLRFSCWCAASALWLGYGSGSAVAGLSLLLAATRWLLDLLLALAWVSADRFTGDGILNCPVESLGHVSGRGLHDSPVCASYWDGPLFGNTPHGDLLAPLVDSACPLYWHHSAALHGGSYDGSWDIACHWCSHYWLDWLASAAS